MRAPEVNLPEGVLAEFLAGYWVCDRMSVQGVGEHAVGTLLPDSVRLVLAKFQRKELQSGASNLVERVAVDDGDQRTIVGVHG